MCFCVCQVPIGHAEEVEQVFDAISYCKGASVVRMLYAVLGHDDFRKGLQLYMNRCAPAPRPLSSRRQDGVVGWA